MHYKSFDTEEVDGWIEDCASEVADNDMWDDELLNERVDDVVDRCITYPIDYLMLCAKYGPDDAARGCDYEDSPLYLFEVDVTERARQIAEDNGMVIPGDYE